MRCCTCGKMEDRKLKKVVFHVGKRVPDRLILLWLLNLPLMGQIRGLNAQ